MILSTRGKYGLIAMYDIASNQEQSPVAIKSIAARQQLSESYLEQLVASLKKAGLVTSKRGAQGGYVLKRDAGKITIGEILSALEGSMSITECVDTPGCGQTCSCPSRGVFLGIQKGIDKVLDSMTLKDMIDQSCAPQQ